MRMRPGRSVTSILPSGKNASDHGWTRPLATVCTSSCPADDANVVSSPRVLVAIRKVAANRIAALSATVTSATGVFTMAHSRCHAPHRCEKRYQKNAGDYAGIGIAMVTLIDSTVRLTIRHSDSAPIASEAATAWVNRDEATGARLLSKPGSPGDRIMV